MTNYSADEINAAIANGQTVTATQSDVERRGQPRRGLRVTLTQAFDSNGRTRATARGYTGRFGVESVEISGVSVAAAFDHDAR